MISPVASSREDAWIETMKLKYEDLQAESRPPARTRGLKLQFIMINLIKDVASSREDAWTETLNYYMRP